MAYNPVLKLHLASGIVDTRYYASGLCRDFMDSQFVSCRRGGSFGGAFSLDGSLRDAVKLESNALVIAYRDADDADSAFWRGRVQQARARYVEKDEHRYECRGAWQELAGVTIGQAVKLGASAECEADTETVALAFAWLFVNVIEPTGICDGSAIAACDTAIGELILDEGMTLDEAIETLELMASGDKGGVWVSRVNAADAEFRFGEISTAAADVQVEVEQEFIEAAEETTLYRAEDIVVIFGGMLPDGEAAGAMAKRRVANPETPTFRLRERRLSFRGLNRQADMDLVGAGYFGNYRRIGALQIRDAGIVAIDLEDGSIPNPSEGQAAYGSAPTGILQQEYLAQVEVSLGAALEVKVALGEASDGKLSRSAPDLDNPLDGTDGEDTEPNILDRLPEGTYEEPPEVPTGGSPFVYLVPHSNSDFYDGGARADGIGGR